MAKHPLGRRISNFVDEWVYPFSLLMLLTTGINKIYRRYNGLDGWTKDEDPED